MSEQRTEKTHPLHGLEPKQPEPKRCECGACVFGAGPMAWYWQPMQEKMLRRVHEYSHLRIYPNDCGFAHGSMSAMVVAPGGYTDATEIAAWARARARERAGAGGER